MGKIAYGRRCTEKKTGTRNETHVVEQSDFPVYEGVHEAIIAEKDWDLAQEKHSKNNYKREKIHDPEHAHILSGILKCPCCGKGMYGNIAKAGRKDNKTRYYYYCKNTVNATGHKCTFRRNIEQSQIDDMLAKLITAMTKEGKCKDAIQDKIGATVDTMDLEKQLSVLNASLHQAETKATYDERKKYVSEHNAGMKVSNLYISQVKRKCGIEVGKNLHVAKTLKFSWVSSPSHLVSCYIVLPLFTNPHKGKNKGKKIW